MNKIESKTYPKWRVTVGNTGKIFFLDSEEWENYKRIFYGKEADLILKPPVKERSRQEEKFYWVVVVPRVAEAMELSRDEAHKIMANIFLKVEEKSPAGFRYTRILSTTELSEERYDQYIFKECIPWAALPTKDDGLSQDSGLGLYLPLPNETDWENL